MIRLTSRRFRTAMVAALAGTTALTGAALLSPTGTGPHALAQEAADTRIQTAQRLDTRLPNFTGGGFADLVDRAAPAVVTVSTTRDVSAGPGPQAQIPPQMRDFFERFGIDPFGGQDPRDGPQRPRQATGVGSGFFIDADGHLVTNNHVIDGASAITVTLTDGTEYDATLVGRDPKTDLAVLKVEADRPVPFLTFGDSDGIRVGEWVVAIGNPFGLGSTVTAGILSARGRDINAGPYDDFLQIDASINRGNSGGPTLAADGTVIGVNTAIFSPSGGSVGIGFAIPADLAQQVVTDLIDDGQIERGWLGVQIQTITPDLARSLGLDSADGALVASVQPGSPAQRAGVQPGDVIVDFGGTVIADIKDLTRAAADAEPGSRVPMAVIREDRRRTLDVELGRMPVEDEVAAAAPSDTQPRGSDTLNLALAPLDEAARTRLGLPEDTDGVVVTGAGDTAPVGISPGTVIQRVGSTPVSTPNDLIAAVRAARDSGRDSVPMLILRNGRQAWIAADLAIG